MSGWFIIREDFNDNVFVMNNKPFLDKARAQAELDNFLFDQLKPHHQDYEVTNEVPEGATIQPAARFG